MGPIVILYNLSGPTRKWVGPTLTRLNSEVINVSHEDWYLNCEPNLNIGRLGYR